MSPFNPGASRDNCVGGVCAFLNSVKEGRLHTASPHVASNAGSIATVLRQVKETVGLQFGRRQFNTLSTARSRQFFVVFRGSSATVSDHVAIGIVNGGRSLIYDPQTGRIFRNLADFGSFTAYPLRFGN